ncbi:MAG TPA: cytochrome C biogenesis protein, partial [Alcanivorax sp.]|nr:cytochrome C biogenesis protein [Alcanivorax sp.]
AGESGGQPLAARRVLAESFPIQVTLRPGDWLQAYPAELDQLRVAARYTPAPGSSVDQANLNAAPTALDLSRRPAASLTIRR